MTRDEYNELEGLVFFSGGKRIVMDDKFVYLLDQEAPDEYKILVKWRRYNGRDK